MLEQPEPSQMGFAVWADEIKPSLMSRGREGFQAALGPQVSSLMPWGVSSVLEAGGAGKRMGKAQSVAGAAS